MLIYHQSTGLMTNEAGDVVEHGFAGNDYRADVNPNRIHGKNNPYAQNIHCIGPLPRGMYTIMEWQDRHPGLGPLVAELVPDTDNEMFGRSGFFNHGAGGNDPGNSSEGCIVAPHAERQAVKDSGETRLQVVA